MAPLDPTECTLLVVTARQPDREALKAFLSPPGYRLFFALSGAQVLADAPALDPDVILLDSRLPDLDGFEVCRRLKADDKIADIPVILMTEPDGASTRQACYQAGASSALVHPFDLDELLAQVNAFAQLSHLRRTGAKQDRASFEDGAPSSNQSELLERLILALSIRQETHEILNSTCEVLTMAFESSGTYAWWLDDDKTHFEVIAEHFLAAHPNVSAINNKPLYLAGQRSTPEDTLRVKDIPWLKQWVDTDGILAGSPADVSVQQQESFLGDGTIAILILPFTVRDEVAGFVELDFHKPRLLSEPELELARSIASAVGEAIETARLYQRLQNYADFLDQALAQRTLELKGERYRTQSILEALGEAVVVTDLEGAIQYVNQAAVELTGYRQEEMLGQRMRLWRSHRQTAELYTQMLDTIYNGQTWRGEVINERKDGTLYNAALTVAPYFDPRDSDRPAGFVSVQRDITPVKQAERLKDQFVSNVSHELRTPLSIITLLTGNLDTLYEDLDEEKRRKLIHDIRGHVQVLNDLLNGVLEISRLDGGQAPRDYQVLDLAQVAREEVEKQMPLAKDHLQTLYASGADHLFVNGNEGQLRQVVRNLLNNAIKYTPSGGYIVCDCISLTSEACQTSDWPGCTELPPGQWTGVRVVDSGIGIGQEDLPHLFERFYRVSSQGDIPGAGLGLSIAKELVHLHNGFITVTSTPGEGSIFAFYLPLSEEN